MKFDSVLAIIYLVGAFLALLLSVIAYNEDIYAVTAVCGGVAVICTYIGIDLLFRLLYK